MMTTQTTMATRSERAPVGTWCSSCVQVVLRAQPPENECGNAPVAVAVLDAQHCYEYRFGDNIRSGAVDNRFQFRLTSRGLRGAWHRLLNLQRKVRVHERSAPIHLD